MIKGIKDLQPTALALACQVVKACLVTDRVIPLQLCLDRIEWKLCQRAQRILTVIHRLYACLMSHIARKVSTQVYLLQIRCCIAFVWVRGSTAWACNGLGESHIHSDLCRTDSLTQLQSYHTCWRSRQQQGVMQWCYSLHGVIAKLLCLACKRMASL